MTITRTKITLPRIPTTRLKAGVSEEETSKRNSAQNSLFVNVFDLIDWKKENNLTFYLQKCCIKSVINCVQSTEIQSRVRDIKVLDV